MSPSKIKTLYEVSDRKRIHQGDILKDLQISMNFEKQEVSIMLPFSVVMSQDCDLEQDFDSRNDFAEKKSNDKFLPTVLVCPAYIADKFFEGKHLSNWNMRPIHPNERVRFISNHRERYHHLEPDLKKSVPELIIDFKHFYTIPTEILGAQLGSSYLISINELFRERLSQRFANYLSRFGLPILPTTPSASEEGTDIVSNQQ